MRRMARVRDRVIVREWLGSVFVELTLGDADHAAERPSAVR
jgi:hypothetical protein